MYKFGNQKKGISISQRQREVPPQTRRTHHEKRITHRVAPLSSLFLRRFLRNAPRRSSRSESEKQKRSVSVLCQLFHPQTWEKEGTRKNTDRRSPAEMYRVFFFLQGASSLLKSESGKFLASPDPNLPDEISRRPTMHAWEYDTDASSDTHKFAKHGHVACLPACLSPSLVAAVAYLPHHSSVFSLLSSRTHRVCQMLRFFQSEATPTHGFRAMIKYWIVEGGGETRCHPDLFFVPHQMLPKPYISPA